MADLGPIITAPRTPTDQQPLPTSASLPTTSAVIPSSLPLPKIAEVEVTRPAAPPGSERPPPSADLGSLASAGLRASISPKAARVGLSTRHSPVPLTGIAAMADERRMNEEKERRESQKQSPNPARNGLSALLGEQNAPISRPQDAPSAAPNPINEPVASVSRPINIPDPMPLDPSVQPSPESASSYGTAEGTIAATASAGSTNSLASLASPGAQATSLAASHGETTTAGPSASELTTPGDERPSNKALSFPPPFPAGGFPDDGRAAPARGMSLPMPGFNQNRPRSPTAKKHKCPYCATDFTRHHNLKSHLLTHSHEKPYICPTCQARFRRLHDLKRHTKLHTGERPHSCPKCGRRFARGDALARHTKGQGGCAGRRASAGSYGGDDDYGDSSHGAHDTSGGAHPVEDHMDGLLYTGPGAAEGERIEEEPPEMSRERRRLSLPSMRAHDAPTGRPHENMAGTQDPYPAQSHSSTYPPASARPGIIPRSSSIHRPSHNASVNSTTAPPSNTRKHTLSPKASAAISSTYAPGPPTSMFSATGMTESPKPISPHGSAVHLGHGDGSSAHRHRSPSLTQHHLSQQPFGRHGTGRTPPPIGLPPPISAPANANPPQLPSLPGLAPPDTRYPLHSPSTTAPPQSLHGGGPVGQAATSTGSGTPGGSTSSHGQGSGESLRGLLPGPENLWAYVRGLEDKINRLQDEVTSLRSQVVTQNRA